MTLAQLWESMTAAELQLWSIYYQMRHDDRERERR